MKHHLSEVFLSELSDIYDAELQIISAMPKLITAAHCEKLKKGLRNHLDETKRQVQRLEEVFSFLGLEPRREHCKGMAGLIAECGEALKAYPKSELRDAAIIAKAQRIEHYEIAVYGTLCAFSKELNLMKEVCSLLKDSLGEEGKADKTLTWIAEGGFFSSGVNVRAERKAG